MLNDQFSDIIIGQSFQFYNLRVGIIWSIS